MSSDKKPWHKKWWIITLFVFLGIGIIASAGENPKSSNVNTTEQTTLQEGQNTTVFDVEVLYGKNIDEIRAVLGKPTDGDYTEPTKQQLALGTKV